MDGCYVGRVAADDPLHPILCRVVDEGMGVTKARSFDAFRLNGSNEVYGYEECGSGVKLVCKFFGGRFGWDRKRATWTADREYHSYKELRRYALVGSPHHVIRPLALEPGVNCALVLEYYGGEQLSRAIDSAIHEDAEERLYDRLTALGFYLATQHNRTASGERVDFDEDCAYLDAQLATLRGIGRIGPWDEDELRWLSGLWRMRERMWADQKVWLHGDATPANFLFGGGMDVGAIDLERMKRGDRMFDVGRVAGRAAARVHAGHRGPASRGAVHRPLPVGVRRSLPRPRRGVRVDHVPAALLHGGQPPARRPQRLHRPRARRPAGRPGEGAAAVGMNGIKAVLFDVNGTLVDIRTEENDAVFRAVANVLSYSGVTMRRAEVRAAYVRPHG